MRPTQLALITALSLALTACGAAHIYQLPTPPNGSNSAFGAIASCAKMQGFEVSDHKDAVHVHVGTDAWVYFNTDVNDRLQMVLHLMGAASKASPSHPVARDAKKKGDAIWRCAQGAPAPPSTPVAPASVHAPPAPPAAPAPPPAAPPAPAQPAPVAGAQGKWRTACLQLVTCYADLTRVLCNGATTCKSEIKVKGSPNEQDCTEMLRASKQVIEPLKMMRPDIRWPASCQR